MANRLKLEIGDLVKSLEADFPREDRADDNVVRLDGLREALAKVRAAARRARALIIPERTVRAAARQVDTTNARAVSGQAVRAGMNPDRARAGAQAAGTERQLQSWVRRNVALIRTVPRQLFDQVEDEVRRSWRAGSRHEVLAKRLVERGLVAESRARLIARDQIEKLNGQLTERRQRALGVDRYVWRTVGDERVRDEHEARDGQTFAWSDPPSDGHPGEPINCRCWAEPILDETEAEV